MQENQESESELKSRIRTSRPKSGHKRVIGPNHPVFEGGFNPDGRRKGATNLTNLANPILGLLGIPGVISSIGR